MITLNKRIKKIRETCKTINDLFSTPDFFIVLSEYSSNDFELLIENIAKIITYYLNTNDSNTTYSIPDLLIKIKTTQPTESGLLVSPSNSFYQNYLKINGLNSYAPTGHIRGIDLNKLDTQLSFYPKLSDHYYSLIYTDIKSAILKSFTSPDIIFESILKQPSTKELPLVVGTEEKTYYRSVLELRLKNAPEIMRKTCATIGNKVINHIIGRDSLLVIFPSTIGKYQVPKKDIDKNVTGEYIPPSYLSFIHLPSKYKLLSICAQNKSLCNGELLDIKAGTPYKTPPTPTPSIESIIYSRYELVSVTENFTYTNTEFSGDINYDIDLIYGELDANNRRETLRHDVGQNFESIKRRDDIIVRKNKNGYEIRNGRHRILYVKHFYTRNFKEYQKDNRLDELKRYVTLPMNVESTLEDDIANEYVIKISKLSRNTRIFKTDINNDQTNLIITISGKAYSVTSTSELIELYNYLTDSNYNNVFYIGESEEKSVLNYEIIFDTMILTLKENLFKMDFLDIIKYLKVNGITIQGTSYSFEKINYYQLYHFYVDLTHKLQLNEIFKRKKDIIKAIENKYKLEEIGKLIMEIIYNNPSLIAVSWQELYELIKEYPSFQECDADFLYEAATVAGYQKLKVEYMYNDMKYIKGSKK